MGFLNTMILDVVDIDRYDNSQSWLTIIPPVGALAAILMFSKFRGRVGTHLFILGCDV